MPASNLPNHLRPRREKVFGDGRGCPLDRNAKVRIMTRARALMRRTEKGKHYGAITAKALDVLQALLWKFHNAQGGLCFPSYESIAEAAGCCRSTVAQAIRALEDSGILSWVNRITRIRDRTRDLFGQWASRWRIIRTSNAYVFRDLGAGQERGWASKSEFRAGLLNQESFVTTGGVGKAPGDLSGMSESLLKALHGLGTALAQKKGLSIAA